MTRNQFENLLEKKAQEIWPDGRDYRAVVSKYDHKKGHKYVATLGARITEGFEFRIEHFEGKSVRELMGKIQMCVHGLKENERLKDTPVTKIPKL